MRRLLLFSLLYLLAAGCAGSRKGNISDYTARRYGRIAFSSYNEGNLTDALEFYRQALWYAGRSDQPLLRAKYTFNIGRVFFEKGVFDSAVIYLYESYDEFTFYGDSIGASSSAGFLALAYASEGEIDSAWVICGGKYREAQNAFWNTVKARISLIRNNLNDASELLREAATQYDVKKERHALALNCYYRASVAFSTRSFSTARILLDSAMNFLDRVEDGHDRWKVLLGLSAVEFRDGSERNGYRMYKRAQECVPLGIAVPALERVRGCKKFIY